MPIIVVENLQKEFRRARRFGGRLGWLRTFVSRETVTKVAVDGISFTIEAGELVGLVGPNGAGKSTTIKMLTGVLVPTAGEVVVRGLVPWRDRLEHARRMGVVFGQRSQLWWDLPTIDSFELLRHIYRVPEERYRRNLAHFREILGLEEFLDTPVRQLSLGQRMRADLAAAFMHDPEVVFLDEPTIGLDLVAKDHIREFVKEVNRRHGVTVILTTHDMADVEAVCRRIMVIDQGKIILDGSIEGIRGRFGRRRVLVVDFEVTQGRGTTSPDTPLDGLKGLVEEAGAQVVRFETSEPEAGQGSDAGSRAGARTRAWCQFDREHTSAAGVIAAAGRWRPIRDLSIEETDIEDIIRRIYQNGATAAAGGL